MKIIELHEVAPAPERKLAKLKNILTSEVLANHELILNLLAGKMSFSDMDALAAELKNVVPDDDQIKAQLELILKALPKDGAPKLDYDNATIYLTGFIASAATADGVKKKYIIGYTKGKWYLTVYPTNFYLNQKTWKFDTEEEVLAFALKRIPKEKISK